MRENALRVGLVLALVVLVASPACNCLNPMVDVQNPACGSDSDCSVRGADYHCCPLFGAGAGKYCVLGSCPSGDDGGRDGGDKPCPPGCTGCCQNGECKEGFSSDACGGNGRTCQVCPAGSSCLGGETCSGCDPTSCSACCFNGLCQTSNATTACGRNGAICSDCSLRKDANRCMNGQCVCGGTGKACDEGQRCVDGGCVCNSDSCSTGCCDSANKCQTIGVLSCADAGAACRTCDLNKADTCANGDCRCGASPACGVGLKCVGGMCRCDPDTCTGCCNGDRCETGTQQATCGMGGAKCQSCPSGQSCTDAGCSGCLPGADGGCASGCCSNGSCVSPPTDDRCGQGGLACADCTMGGAADRCVGGRCSCGPGGTLCGPGQVCNSGACTCTAASCPSGCCMGNVCVAPRDRGHCAPAGQQCMGCGIRADSCSSMGNCVCSGPGVPCGPGQECLGGMCRCTSASCNGCCNGDVCQIGNAQTACGSDGGVCRQCGMGQRCSAGQCICDGNSCGSGCCTTSSTCAPGDDNQECGEGGAPCKPCGTGMCQSGQCTGGGCTWPSCGFPGACNLTCGINSDSCVGSGCGCGAGPPCGAFQQCISGNCYCTADSCTLADPTRCCSGNFCLGPAAQGNRACVDRPLVGCRDCAQDGLMCSPGVGCVGGAGGGSGGSGGSGGAGGGAFPCGPSNCNTCCDDSNSCATQFDNSHCLLPGQMPGRPCVMCGGVQMCRPNLPMCGSSPVCCN